MSGYAKTWIAFAVAALATTSAVAGKPRIITPRQIDAASFEKAADGRRVKVTGGEPLLAQKSVPLAARFVKADEMLDAQEAVDGGEPVLSEPSDDGTMAQPLFGSCDLASGAPCGGCADGCTPCDVCGQVDCCCDPYWRHRSFVYGDFLYLLPADGNLSHAIQQNGSGGTGTVPAGTVGVLQPNFATAFRTGFGVAVGCNATIATNYSNFHSHTANQISAPGGTGGTVNSLVLFPGTINTGSTSSLATAIYDIDYQLADLEYRRLLHGGCYHALNYVLGARYGKLQQQFSQTNNFAQPTGVVRAVTNINFEGVGLRAGLDGNRRLGDSLLALYGRTSINVLFGEVNSNYTQVDTTTTVVQAHSIWRDRRAVPILDYEIGLQWTSRNGHWRASTGYYTAFWFNTVSTGQYVQAVQNANFVNLGQTLSFNGLVSRVEYRF